jgi:cytochrome c oxidase assembly factor CtaG
MIYFQTAPAISAPAGPVSDLLSRWNPADPLAILVIFFAAVYTFGLWRLSRRTKSFPVERLKIVSAYSGFASLFIALAGPFDGFATEVFWLHMTQHLVISLAAAPLLLLASPMPVYLWALPETAREGAGELLGSHGIARRTLDLLLMPRVTIPLFIGTLFIWHAPALFSAALNNAYIHYLQHFTFFATAMLFWWPIIGPAPVRSKLSYPQRIVYLLLVVTPTAVLASIITMTRSVIYTDYLDAPMRWGMTALDDQTMGGLVLWLPGNSLYLAALTALFFTWASKEEKKAIHTPPPPGPRRRPPSPRGGTLRK